MVPPMIGLPGRSLAALFGLLVAACVVPEDGAPPPGSPVTAPPNTESRPAPVFSGDETRQLAQAHRQLGLGLEAAGDIAGAVDEFEAALAIGPWPVDPSAGGIENTPYGDLTRICRSGAQAQLVIRTCTRVITSFRYSQSELADFLANRGAAYFYLSDTDRARTDYKTALDLQSSNPRALFGRGRLKALAGNHTFALTDFNRAIGGGFDNPETRYARALSLAAVGDFDAAIEDFDRVLSDPEGLAAYPDAYRDRAQAHCRTGQAAAAAVGWQVWLDSTPGGGAEVWEMLAASGDLEVPSAGDFGPAALTALRAWIEAGCPEAVDG